MIVKLVKLCISNSVVHYRGSWFLAILGLPTGGPESGSLANLVVYFVLEKILLIHPSIAYQNKMSQRKRFLDDLWFAWCGTKREFDKFKTALNTVGVKHGITFKGGVGTSVDFLDVSVTLKGTHFITGMYVKPTDASRYLHRRSDHAGHTFRSIPYTQFRRAILLCSEEVTRDGCIDYIVEKLKNSGYKYEEIENARTKALSLNRNDMLKPRKKKKDAENESQKQLIFTVNRDHEMTKKIKSILHNNQADIDKLLGGHTQLIVAERKNNSTASLVFAKSAFSKCIIEEAENQMCKSSNGCLTCKVINLDKNVTLWKDDPSRKINVKLDFKCNCLTENCIYLYVCKLCKANDGFYIGQTTNTCRGTGRSNGHRSDFNYKDYKKSALSYHVYEEHPDHLMEKLNNYKLGVIRAKNPMELDRTEDYYVELTNADLSLNRYKVTTH